MSKTKLDDGFHSYLVEGASFEGAAGIPILMNLKNISIPQGLIPFNKIHQDYRDKKKYIHFYLHDRYFNHILPSLNRYIRIFQQFDGVITPDFTMLDGQSSCLQQTNTYFNRAVGFYLQKKGIPVIPNVRWSGKDSFSYCFLGIPQNYIVSVSTHGCIRSQSQKDTFKQGFYEMLSTLHPSAVIVHGRFPPYIFSEFEPYISLYHFPSYLEEIHQKNGGIYGGR